LKKHYKGDKVMNIYVNDIDSSSKNYDTPLGSKSYGKPPLSPVGKLILPKNVNNDL